MDPVTIAQDAAGVTITLHEPLTLKLVGEIWEPVLAACVPAVAGEPAKKLIFDFSAAPHEFETGAASLVVAAENALQTQAEFVGLGQDAQNLFARVRFANPASASLAPPEHEHAELGEILKAGLVAAANGIAFFGEVAIAVAQFMKRRRQFRFLDFLRFADTAGVKAIPLVLLLGFLMGLILAFQSSIPLKRFGADIFVVNLVAISLVRELGPLLASVILAGRTGSAFAAELGTMVVNEEVAALRTMGIDPITMLVLPRLAATMLVMPGLSLILELAGMFGMAAVMAFLGFPLIAVWHQAVLALTLRDLLGGLFKALWFGAAVAVIGCRTGLNAGQGPRAVGEAATAAVVGGIFSTIVIDGVFTIMYYRLGW